MYQIVIDKFVSVYERIEGFNPPLIPLKKGDVTTRRAALVAAGVTEGSHPFPGLNNAPE